MGSPWRTAPRGAAARAPRTQPPVGTIMPQDGPWATVATWHKGSGALVLQSHDLKDGAPRGTAEEGSVAARAMWVNCCPRGLSGLTKDTLKTQKQKQCKTNSVKYRKGVREASSIVHSP